MTFFLNKSPFFDINRMIKVGIVCIQYVERISTEEGFMIIKKSNFASSRRQFLKNALPAGALFCFGCNNNLFAFPRVGDKYQVDTEKHPFLQDAGMTTEDVFNFTYRYELIPLMKKLEKNIGRDKFIDMLKEAVSEMGRELGASMAQNMRKLDFDMFKIMTKSLDPPFNLAMIYEIVEDTDKVLEGKFTECLWAKTYLEADAAEIGYVLQCYSSEAMYSAFSSKIKYSNPKNMLKGDDYCIERIVWEG